MTIDQAFLDRWKAAGGAVLRAFGGRCARYPLHRSAGRTVSRLLAKLADIHERSGE